MKSKSFMELITPEAVQSFAKKNYNTYVAHCEARKLKPMLFHEFLKNYAFLAKAALISIEIAERSIFNFPDIVSMITEVSASSTTLP